MQPRIGVRRPGIADEVDFRRRIAAEQRCPDQCEGDRMQFVVRIGSTKLDAHYFYKAKE